MAYFGTHCTVLIVQRSLLRYSSATAVLGFMVPLFDFNNINKPSSPLGHIFVWG